MSSPARGPEPNDAALRREVLGPAHSWMLQAPAGSGKTELLMQRVLACLATVEQPESVLAITFTRKAASEMRNRIVSALKKAGELSVEEIRARPPHERQALELARKVLGVSAELGWKILSHPARLQVRTLDSFCEAVAQRAPLKGMLGGAAQVTEDAQPLYKLAAQRTIDELAALGARGDAVAILLKHRDNNVGELRDLLAAMLQQREQWLHFLGRSDALDCAQQQELRQRLEAALALAVEEELALIRGHAAAVLSAAQQGELFCLMRYRAAQADAAAAERVDDTGSAKIDSIAATAEVVPISPSSVPPNASPLRSALASARPAHPLRDIASWPEASADALPAWRAIAEFLLTADNALRKTVNKNCGFPCETNEQKAVRKRCLELLAQIAQHSDAAEFCETLHGVRRLPEPRYSEPQWEFMLALLEVLPRAAAHLQVVFLEHGALDFAE